MKASPGCSLFFFLACNPIELDAESSIPAATTQFKALPIYSSDSSHSAFNLSSSIQFSLNWMSSISNFIDLIEEMNWISGMMAGIIN